MEVESQLLFSKGGRLWRNSCFGRITTPPIEIFSVFRDHSLKFTRPLRFFPSFISTQCYSIYDHCFREIALSVWVLLLMPITYIIGRQTHNEHFSDVDNNHLTMAPHMFQIYLQLLLIPKSIPCTVDILDDKRVTTSTRYGCIWWVPVYFGVYTWYRRIPPKCFIALP